MLPTPDQRDRPQSDQGRDGDERPLGVVLSCTDCDHVYEPTAADLAAGRTGCPDPDCGGWTFSSALTVPPTTGGAR